MTALLAFLLLLGVGAIAVLVAALMKRRAVAAGAVIAVFVLTTPVFGVLLVLPSEPINQLAGLASPMMTLAGVGAWVSGDDTLAPPLGPYGPVYLVAAVALVAACVALLLLRYRKVAAK